jgi:preprotein translocase subunit SecE
MARDRQRAKQRRRRQGGPAPRGGRSGNARDIGLDDATVDRGAAGDEAPAEAVGLGDSQATPDPLKHSSADVDQAKLAEAGAVPPDVNDELDDFDDLERAPDEAEDDLVPAPTGELDPAVAERPPRRQRGKVLTFLRHCGDELRRVQWPNRRQVGQATAVVLGFVVLAGSYLGLLDALWKPIIDAIL